MLGSQEELNKYLRSEKEHPTPVPTFVPCFCCLPNRFSIMDSSLLSIVCELNYVTTEVHLVHPSAPERTISQSFQHQYVLGLLEKHNCQGQEFFLEVPAGPTRARSLDLLAEGTPVAQRIPNPDLDLNILSLTMGQTCSEARRRAFSLIVIFRADLFFIDWRLSGPSQALSRSGSSPWPPSRNQACLEVLSPASPDGWVQLRLRPPLFFHRGLLFLGLGWLSKSYWVLCRRGALRCPVYIGNCVHCSGLISWCLPFSFVSDRVSGVACDWGWGRGHAHVRAVCAGSRRAPSHGEREPMRVLVRKLLRL